MKNPNHKNEMLRCDSEVAGKIKEIRLKCCLILPKFYIIKDCCKFI